MRRSSTGCYDAGAGYVGGGFVLLICVLMIGQSVLREFGVRTGAVNDIVSWFCAAAAFFAMAHAFKHGDFVRVTLLLEQCRRRARALELVALSIAAVAVAYLAWWAEPLHLRQLGFNDIAAGPAADADVDSAARASRSARSCCWWRCVDELVLVLRGDRPTYVVAVEERHAQGDFSRTSEPAALPWTSSSSAAAARAA